MPTRPEVYSATNFGGRRHPHACARAGPFGFSALQIDAKPGRFTDCVVCEGAEGPPSMRTSVLVATSHPCRFDAAHRRRCRHAEIPVGEALVVRACVGGENPECRVSQRKPREESPISGFTKRIVPRILEFKTLKLSEVCLR